MEEESDFVAGMRRLGVSVGPEPKKKTVLDVLGTICAVAAILVALWLVVLFVIWVTKAVL